jgi:hypothetical protein
MGLLSPPDFGGWGDACRSPTMVGVTADLGASGVFRNVPFRREVTRPFLRACARIKAYNEDHPDKVYKVRLFGTYSCRDATCCPGRRSNHAWGLAVDINWDSNPFHGSTSSWGKHDMPKYFIDAFEAEGFHWLAQFDPMHFERFQHEGCEPVGTTGPTQVDYTQFVKGGFLMALSEARQEALADQIDGLISGGQQAWKNLKAGTKTAAQYMVETDIPDDASAADKGRRLGRVIAAAAFALLNQKAASATPAGPASPTG